MDPRNFFQSLSRTYWQDQQDGLTNYSAIPSNTTPSDNMTLTPLEEEIRRGDEDFETFAVERQRQPVTTSLSRFLADFTLGFADGLTVSFALTAGLSSLGQAKTVIYAGMAEICAGCISMGIGGYLAIKGEQESEVESHGDEEKLGLQDYHYLNVEEYLAPLNLSPELLLSVKAYIDSSPYNPSYPSSFSTVDRKQAPSPRQNASPIIAGFSIAIGYLLGDLLPLFPYFFVTNVIRGLHWSFVICILALFTFGFVKHYLLHSKATYDTQSKKIKHCLIEGIRMAILGGLAAVAAVLCVKFFERIVA